MNLTYKDVLNSISKWEVFMLAMFVGSALLALFIAEWVVALLYALLAFAEYRYYEMRARAYVYSKVADEAMNAINRIKKSWDEYVNVRNKEVS